ncbi:MAG: hypothetical protein ABIF87_12180 [Pseudomonadota bacterium]
MDIKKITDSLNPAKISHPKPIEEKRSFQHVLNNVVDAKGSKATQETAPISSVSPVSLLHAPDSRYNMLQQADTVVSLLDNYSKSLANPQKSLKNIEGVITRMEKEVNSLKDRTNDMVEHDEKLLRLVNDIAVTANVEIFKFYRGDYI